MTVVGQVEVTAGDVLRVVAALSAPLIVAGLKRISTTLKAILKAVERLEGVETKVDHVEQKVDKVERSLVDVQYKVETIQVDAGRKHLENSGRLDILSAHVANQESTSKMLAEAIGRPVQQIADVLVNRDGPTGATQ